MTNQPTPGTSSMSDVLDRVLDKGIVIDAEVSFRLVGLIVAGVEARIVVASIETYLEYADLIAGTGLISWRPVGSGDDDETGSSLTFKYGPGRNRIDSYLNDLPDVPDFD